jgi:hypothetical protein
MIALGKIPKLLREFDNEKWVNGDGGDAIRREFQRNRAVERHP